MQNILWEKLYRLLGDAGITRNNMFTGRHKVSWQALAEAPDRHYLEHICRKQMIEEFCHVVGKRFAFKVKEDIQGREWDLLGFVFNEEELLTLLDAAYRLGRDDSVSTTSLGGIICDVRNNREAAIAAMSVVAQENSLTE